MNDISEKTVARAFAQIEKDGFRYRFEIPLTVNLSVAEFAKAIQGNFDLAKELEALRRLIQ